MEYMAVIGVKNDGWHNQNHSPFGRVNRVNKNNMDIHHPAVSVTISLKPSSNLLSMNLHLWFLL